MLTLTDEKIKLDPNFIQNKAHSILYFVAANFSNNIIITCSV